MNLDDLRSYLILKPPVIALVVARIQVGELSQNTVLPAIVLETVSDVPDGDHDPSSIPGWSVARIRVKAYGATYSDAYAVKEAVRKAPMQQYKGMMGNTRIDHVFLDDENSYVDKPREGSSDMRHVIETDYRIAYYQSQPIFP